MPQYQCLNEETRTKTRGNTVRFAACLILLQAAAAVPAFSAETDQFLTWDIELKDSADAFNRYFNEGIERYLDHINRRTVPVESPEDVTIGLYYYFFQGLPASRLRRWLNTSPDVQRYPDDSVGMIDYQKRSIYWAPAFPYILPMAHTIRIGDIYFGTDKVSHMMGFGRRYYERYMRYRAEGDTDEDAMTRVVHMGIHNENNMVGRLVDGIFARADLEGNFQGFRMALDMCGGPNPHIVRDNGTWRLKTPVDIRNYVTPDLDESWNTSHYWGMRRRTAIPLIRERYCDKRDGPIVKERFARYAQYEPSFSQKAIAAYFKEKGGDPRDEQSLDAICQK